MVRAAHQLLDDPPVFADRLALAMIGEEARATLRSAPEKFQTPGSRHIRAFMAARSRCAEDELASAIKRGAKQYVVLGAGLDTYVYRNPSPTPRVFEVDYPATQAWKRERLEAAGISIPSSVVFVPVDFEKMSLSSALECAGFEPQQITFFSWLGVTPYLPSETAMATLTFIASMPSGSGVVFDYAVARASLNPVEQIAQDVLARRVARGGEPFQLFFEPEALAAMLRGVGFQEIEDLGPIEIDARYFRDRADGLRVSAGLAHVLRARI
jgi:methyltransferase (TIGR00027 family)